MWAIVSRRICQNIFELGSAMPENKKLYPGIHTPCYPGKFVLSKDEVSGYILTNPMMVSIAAHQINSFIRNCIAVKGDINNE
ncbi:hypothetical protein AD45P2_00295 [Alteromonas phage vB_AmaP_AD45-P2]|uniref:Uncharacterized protein n=1 Tax=Pseudorhizobium pelagicum TaxID=1509405 RepID=A0A922NZA6_9HYPH|nr:hypothetical protein M610_gp059 [Alteromonas phage vB_AmaP_AD45-P1]AGM46877.1 hypothetical protein AD45P1_00295 [Alteromonas phage vB_AmaP_AD45-P1]AGM47114.1 hypothetical protein AD45P4_00295 [Alteromonas phage vB_AmaP_AD45-P4]AGM47230.1 hypothetical protein AD45P2_00295 [Alteromonas phage vB_AmaP_AD45-P2]KEQ05647.1 hypothetical protein GV68_08960 [Pseudorhizobium pelagicum]